MQSGPFLARAAAGFGWLAICGNAERGRPVQALEGQWEDAMKPVQAITVIVAVPLLAACGATHGAHGTQGTVTGRLVLEGGPLGPGGQQPGERPITGSVRFTAGRGQVVTIAVGSAGTFSARLPAGTYAVSGRSPSVTGVRNGTSRQTPCSQPISVTVTARHTTRITLTCIVP